MVVEGFLVRGRVTDFWVVVRGSVAPVSGSTVGGGLTSLHAEEMKFAFVT